MAPDKLNSCSRAAIGWKIVSETQIPESEQPENRTASSEDSEPTSDTRCGNSAQWSIDAAVAAGSSGADFRSNAEPPESGTRSKQSAHPFSTQDKNRYVTIAELGRGGMGTVVSDRKSVV